MKLAIRFVPLMLVALFALTAAGETTTKPTAVTTKSFTYKKASNTDLELIVYYPPDWKESDKRPGMVFFFGGGWTNGTIKTFDEQSRYFAGRGMVTACADYRVKSKQNVTPKECAEDAKSALRYFRKNASTLGVDPDRIVASGGSAGGHIAACTTLTPGLDAEGEDTKISAKANLLVLYNPVLMFGPQLAQRVNNDDAIAKALSPTLYLTKETPATLLLYGTTDFLLRDGKEYMAKSKELGHHAEMYLAEGQGHGFFNKQPWKDKTTARVAEFLEANGYLAKLTKEKSKSDK